MSTYGGLDLGIIRDGHGGVGAGGAGGGHGLSKPPKRLTISLGLGLVGNYGVFIGHTLVNIILDCA